MLNCKKVLGVFIGVIFCLFSIAFAYSGGTGEPNNPYQIADVNDLLALAGTPTDYSKCFILTADINMGYEKNFTDAIIATNNAFTGTFDGNGRKITHFTINGGNNTYIGLFGLIDGPGSVKNLGLENFSVSGNSFIGGLVGHNSGGYISNCYSMGSVSGEYGIGGLVGYNYYGNITDCYSISNVSGENCIGGLCGENAGNISNCYSMGSVSGEYGIGGLVGRNCSSSISNCYSTDAVGGGSGVGGLVGVTRSSSISNSYSTGSTTGTNDTGGLCGQNLGSSIIASFWDVNTSGQSWSAGGEGKTTEEMQTLSTYTNAGWDFSYDDGDDADWFIQIDEYPILTWQISPADIWTDGKNNFKDFAVLAEYWMRKDCRLYNDYCDWADLNFDGTVDYEDLFELMSYWLEEGIYE